MCQWGSQRWASSRGMSHTWICDHYFNAYGWTRKNLTAPPPPPPPTPYYKAYIPVKIAVNAALNQGYEIDGSGGIHPLNNSPAVVGGYGYWAGQHFARDIAITAWGGGGPQGYSLVGQGSVHPFGGAPAVTSGPYWTGNDAIARALEMSPNGGGQGYLLDLQGGVHPLSGAPAPTGFAYWTYDIARDFAITEWSSPPKGYTLDCAGVVHNWGGAAPIYTGTPFWP